MRILVVLPRNMHFGPGAATSIDLVAHDLAVRSRHAATTLVACEPADPLFADIRTASLGASAWSRLVPVRAAAVAALARAEDSDLVVVHQHLPTAAAIARRLPRTPVVLHAHGMPKAVSGLRRRLRARRLDRLAGLVFVSEAARAAHRALYCDAERPSIVVPNGLDPALWTPRDARRPEIVCVGRIEPQKGSLEALRALARVLPARSGWTARFIGPPGADPAYTKTFAAQAARIPGVAWDGALPFDAVREHVSSASVALVASRQEGFGRVAIEAFAAEVALVSTLCGGLREVVGDAGLALERGDAEEIAAALERLIADPDLRSDLARRGRARFEQRFTLDRCARAYDDGLAHILDHAGGGPS